MRLSSQMIIRMLVLFSSLLGGAAGIRAQTNPFNSVPGMQGLQGGQGGGQKKSSKDSLHHRTGLEDTLTLTFRYMDSTHVYRLDTSVSNFD